jgi:hypothetical protein
MQEVSLLEGGHGECNSAALLDRPPAVPDLNLG